jgi:hypothetical protein
MQASFSIDRPSSLKSTVVTIDYCAPLATESIANLLALFLLNSTPAVVNVLSERKSMRL